MTRIDSASGSGRGRGPRPGPAAAPTVSPSAHAARLARYARAEMRPGGGATPDHVQPHASRGDGFAGGNHDRRRTESATAETVRQNEPAARGADCPRVRAGWRHKERPMPTSGSPSPRHAASLDSAFPPGSRRPPRVSPPAPGGSSSATSRRAFRLSGRAALSRAGSVACDAAAALLVAFAALVALAPAGPRPDDAGEQHQSDLIHRHHFAWESLGDIARIRDRYRQRWIHALNHRSEIFRSGQFVGVDGDAAQGCAPPPRHSPPWRNPDTIANGILAFTAPASTFLDPSTTYYVLFNGENISISHNGFGC